ncbi:MAG: hypothetical protein AAF380_01440, partial [Bacteroidota bacterium]
EKAQEEKSHLYLCQKEHKDTGENELYWHMDKANAYPENFAGLMIDCRPSDVNVQQDKVWYEVDFDKPPFSELEKQDIINFLDYDQENMYGQVIFQVPENYYYVQNIDYTKSWTKYDPDGDSKMIYCQLTVDQRDECAFDENHDNPSAPISINYYEIAYVKKLADQYPKIIEALPWYMQTAISYIDKYEDFTAQIKEAIQNKQDLYLTNKSEKKWEPSYDEPEDFWESSSYIILCHSTEKRLNKKLPEVWDAISTIIPEAMAVTTVDKLEDKLIAEFNKDNTSQQNAEDKGNPATPPQPPAQVPTPPNPTPPAHNTTPEVSPKPLSPQAEEIPANPPATQTSSKATNQGSNTSQQNAEDKGNPATQPQSPPQVPTPPNPTPPAHNTTPAVSPKPALPKPGSPEPSPIPINGETTPKIVESNQEATNSDKASEHDSKPYVIGDVLVLSVVALVAYCFWPKKKPRPVGHNGQQKIQKQKSKS